MDPTHDELLKRFHDNKRYAQFIKDMQNAGIPVRMYSGRAMFGKECPAAVSSDYVSEQEIYSATKVKLKIDNLGRRYVLYP